MNGSAALRVFVALEVPDPVRELIRREQAVLRRELPRARWTRPEGQHLTLKFLGETPRSTVDELSETLRERLSRLGPVRIELGGAGFFPTPRRPRVAWIGGDTDRGAEVAAMVDAVTVELGFRAERRPWSPHLTQARLHRPWPRRAVERFLDWGRALDLPAFDCAEAVVFSSDLQPAGAVYTALERVALG